MFHFKLNHGIIFLKKLFFFKGGDLREKIKSQIESKKKFPEETIYLWMIEIILGLDYLHNVMKCDHLDIKPAYF